MPTRRVRLLDPQGRIVRHTLGDPVDHRRPDRGFRCRVAYAAAPVVADPAYDNTPGSPATLDWDRTLAYRHRLWEWGFGVAEAMDTAQRGAGLDWPTATSLIQRTAAEARIVGARVVAGVATDSLDGDRHELPAIADAYRRQVAVAVEAGAQPVVMASRHLAAVARHQDDYLWVYDRVLRDLDSPVLLHWLGPAFDPALAGYWGSTDLAAATESVLSLIRAHASRVEGIKLSLLDVDHERELRRRLPPGVRLFTGDDFHYAELIEGDDTGHSDALLGVFAAIAPAASAALRALDGTDLPEFRRCIAPTIPLARHLFGTPTANYKTGVVFLSWLNGWQDHFVMVDGAQSRRSVRHLCEAARLADRAGLLVDPDLATQRLRAWLEVHGIAQ